MLLKRIWVLKEILLLIPCWSLMNWKNHFLVFLWAVVRASDYQKVSVERWDSDLG